MKYVYQMCHYCKTLVERTIRRPIVCCYQCGKKRDTERSRVIRVRAQRMAQKNAR